MEKCCCALDGQGKLWLEEKAGERERLSKSELILSSPYVLAFFLFLLGKNFPLLESQFFNLLLTCLIFSFLMLSALDENLLSLWFDGGFWQTSSASLPPTSPHFYNLESGLSPYPHPLHLKSDTRLSMVWHCLHRVLASMECFLAPEMRVERTLSVAAKCELVREGSPSPRIITCRHWISWRSARYVVTSWKSVVSVLCFRFLLCTKWQRLL